MRSVRVRILAILAVLVIAGVGAWQLLPSGEAKTDAITVGTSDVVTSLDPVGAYDAGSWAIYSNIYQSLMTFKPGAVTPEPDAAESCGFVGQKLQTYQCKLRDDLTFTNGRKITAEDVKHSFDRIFTIKSDVGPAGLFPTLDSVTTEGRTITFNLSGKDATFPQKIATGAAAIVDTTKYPEDKIRPGNQVDGSGPYVLKSYEHGTRAELVPNLKYKGALKKTGQAVTIRYFKTSEDLQTSWDAGDVDVAHRQLPSETLAELNMNDPDVRVTEATSAEIRNIIFNVREGTPFADKKVRQAVAALLDRGPLVRKVYQGTVDPLYSLIPTGFIGHSTPFFDTYPSSDPKRAAQLLQQAGAKTPVPVNFAYREGDMYTKETAELRRQLEKDGLFKVSVEAVEWTKYQKEYAAGKYDMYTVGWFPDFPDPDTFSQPLVGTGNVLHSGYSSKKMDQLIAATQQFSDRSRTSSDFKEMQSLVGEDVPCCRCGRRRTTSSPSPRSRAPSTSPKAPAPGVCGNSAGSDRGVRQGPQGRPAAAGGGPGRNSTSSAWICRTSGRSTRNRESAMARAAIGAVRSTSRRLRSAPSLRSYTQNSTSPICINHINCGSSGASSGSLLTSAPAMQRSWMEIAASRAAAESSENGESGLSGSAAFLKNWAAKRWYGSATSSQPSSTPLTRTVRSPSPSSTGRTAAACSPAIRS